MSRKKTNLASLLRGLYKVNEVLLTAQKRLQITLTDEQMDNWIEDPIGEFYDAAFRTAEGREPKLTNAEDRPGLMKVEEFTDITYDLLFNKVGISKDDFSLIAEQLEGILSTTQRMDIYAYNGIYVLEDWATLKALYEDAVRGVNFTFDTQQQNNIAEVSGEWIKLRRKELGLTQEDVAKGVGVVLRTIASWEAGSVIPKSKHHVLKNVLQST